MSKEIAKPNKAAKTKTNVFHLSLGYQDPLISIVFAKIDFKRTIRESTPKKTPRKKVITPGPPHEGIPTLLVIDSTQCISKLQKARKTNW